LDKKYHFLRTTKKIKNNIKSCCLKTPTTYTEKILTRGEHAMKKRWIIAIVAILIIVASFVALRLYYPGGFPGGTGIVTGDWEFATYSGGTYYNQTAYDYPSLVFNVSSTIGSQVYMLSQNSKDVPLTSSTLIRSSAATCKIDWGWLGTGDNYAFLTWNGTKWIADTDNGSNIPERTTISGYDPSTSWRKLRIEVTTTQTRYYIDDQVVATHTTRIPSGDFQFYGELTSTGTAAKLYITSHTY
jgi:hypothetical protein